MKGSTQPVIVDIMITYQFSFWVSFAIVSSLPSASVHLSATRVSVCLLPVSVVVDSPKSLMLNTPAALELALRCPLTGVLSGGDDDKPEIAESTFSSGAGAVSAADMLA